MIIDKSREKLACKYSLASTVVWCCVTTAPAAAAEQPGGFVLEEVQVTARRVEERLQDTPVSVAAFTPEALERRQVFSTDDLDQTTPNLVFNSSARLAGNSSAVVVTIRGIGQTDPTPDVDPGVGIISMTCTWVTASVAAWTFVISIRCRCCEDLRARCLEETP